MSLSHEIITLSNSVATILTIPSNQEDAYSKALSISVQNLDTVKYVYIGSSDVSTSSYGFRLSPGQSIQFDLSPADELYAVGSNTSAQVAVIRIKN